MKVNIIHSGSSGNCAVIDDFIMIDAGWKHVEAYASYLLITHHHTDHTKFLSTYNGLPMYATIKTAEKIWVKNPYVNFNELKVGENIGLLNEDTKASYFITPIALIHDAPCVGFDITRTTEDGEEKRIFFATDFSEIVAEEEFIKNLRRKEYDAIYIECNNTLSDIDFIDDLFLEDGEKPAKDAFHKRKSFQNHCNVGYLIDLFTRAGYNAENKFTEPVTLLHKSSYYYHANATRLVELASFVNVKNPLYE